MSKADPAAAGVSQKPHQLQGSGDPSISCHGQNRESRNFARCGHSRLAPIHHISYSSKKCLARPGKHGPDLSRTAGRIWIRKRQRASAWLKEKVGESRRRTFVVDCRRHEEKSFRAVSLHCSKSHPSMSRTATLVPQNSFGQPVSVSQPFLSALVHSRSSLRASFD